MFSLGLVTAACVGIAGSGWNRRGCLRGMLPRSISDNNLKIRLISANISEINNLNLVTNRDVMNKASLPELT